MTYIRKIIGYVFALVAMLTLPVGCDSGTKNTLNMATKPMTEQYILGYMIQALIEQKTDLTVKITEGVGGGTSNIQPAMEKGEFDLYPEYTGTGWNAVLKKDGLYKESMFEQLQAGYAALGMTWAGMLGFNNTFGLAVTKEVAAKYGLHTYSDLTAVANQLTFGAEYDFFEREDGYNALRTTYGLVFNKTMDLDIGLKYDAIRQHKIDVMNIFTTDGQLSVADVVVLDDDKGLYPSYVCGFVIRNAVLKAHPELQQVFDQMKGLISNAAMADMNYMVEVGGQEPKDVALKFLQAKGLLQ
jgi:osmoprotectant transport system permease protein